MNLLLIQGIIAVFNPKRDFQLILWLFIFVLSLPLITVFVLTNAGIPLVSNKLASVSLNKHQVAIHAPTGKVIGQIEISSTWPVQGIVTLEFGESDFPYQPFHTGIDIADKIGDPVTVFMKGKVIDTESLSWGYGNYVVVDNGNNVTSIYAHLSQINVTQGQEVKPGDIIGYEGTTGWSTGPHVHFQINVFGIPVNPRTFVQGNP